MLTKLQMHSDFHIIIILLWFIPHLVCELFNTSIQSKETKEEGKASSN